MTPISFSQSGVGRSAPIAVDNFLNPFAVGVGATVTGTVTFNIEYTFEDPMDAAPVNWFVASGFSALTASTGGVFSVPCKAISINVTAGTGSVFVEIVQSGTR